MKHIRLFEDSVGNHGYPTGKFSRWPKKKHYRGVRVLRSLDHNNDREEIIDLLKKYHKGKGWFDHYLKQNNIDSPDFKIPYDTHWFELIRPDGKNEVIFFDDFDGGYGDSAGDGFVSATTFDEKYEFTMGAYNFNDEIEVDPDSLDW
jgi:hypothetical protein